MLILFEYKFELQSLMHCEIHRLYDMSRLLLNVIAIKCNNINHVTILLNQVYLNHDEMAKSKSVGCFQIKSHKIFLHVYA